MITATADNIPIVHPMALRRFRWSGIAKWALLGGKIIAHEVSIEDEGMAESRLAYDEDVVDVSNGIFEITNNMLSRGGDKKIPLLVLPSRRWRNNRIGEDIQKHPEEMNEEGILFIGNPIRLTWSEHGGLVIHRESSYIIKSGIQLGY